MSAAVAESAAHMPAPTFGVVVQLARAWVKRHGSARGVRINACALEFVLGAAVCAQESGQGALASHLTTIGLLVSARGASELQRLARESIEID